MFRGDRSYSPWWRRLRILSLVLSALSFQALLILSLLKLDARSDVGSWSWKAVLLPPLLAFVFFLGVYLFIAHVTRHSAFTYTSSSAAGFLLGVRLARLDAWHQSYVFRTVLLVVACVLMCAMSVGLSLTTCEGCHTPWPLLSVGSAVLYALRGAHFTYLCADGWRRLRTMLVEIARFQSFLDQQRLFHDVLPDLYWSSRDAHRGAEVFLFLSQVVLATLGTIWVGGGNCMDICPATYLTSKYLLNGVYVLETLYILSHLLLAYHSRASGLEAVERLIVRLESERVQEHKQQMALLRAEKLRRKNDSTSTR